MRRRGETARSTARRTPIRASHRSFAASQSLVPVPTVTLVAPATCRTAVTSLDMSLTARGQRRVDHRQSHVLRGQRRGGRRQSHVASRQVHVERRQRRAARGQRRRPVEILAKPYDLPRKSCGDPALVRVLAVLPCASTRCRIDPTGTRSFLWHSTTNTPQGGAVVRHAPGTSIA